MARLKLIEYLNNPTLLEQISEDEMILWANEVPYAGLVQRLLAQKLAIANSKKALSVKANTMAILSNANPNQVIKSIEDFKNLILSNEQEAPVSQEDESDESSLNLENSVCDEQEDTTNLVDVGAKQPDIETSPVDTPPVDTSQEVDDKEEHLKIEQNTVTDIDISENDLREEQIPKETLLEIADVEISEFSKWLITLQSLSEEESIEQVEIELEDKELASDALAQLLVSQGHYAQAIAMYEILMLKIPQKSSFFADQIQKLKSL